jgi:SAM-dependent methyltransferase
MVRAAASHLGSGRRRFAFAVAAAQALPFRDRSFDAVVANHMLYHVPDLNRALAEIVRVLPPGGRFFAATNGRHHLRELRRLADVLAPGSFDDDSARFGLEHGADLLAPWFPAVDLLRREDGLAVTEVEPVVAYLLSGAGVQAGLDGLDASESDRRLATVTGKLERELAAHGAIRITKDTGLFVARTAKTDCP